MRKPMKETSAGNLSWIPAFRRCLIPLCTRIHCGCTVFENRGPGVRGRMLGGCDVDDESVSGDVGA